MFGWKTYYIIYVDKHQNQMHDTIHGWNEEDAKKRFYKKNPQFLIQKCSLI